MMAMLLWGLIGFALGALAALARAKRAANRVSPQTLARLRQAQKEDR